MGAFSHACLPCPNKVTVFCRERINTRAADAAIAVYELDPLAGHLQTHATQGGDKVRTIAASCYVVNIFTAARPCHQCRDHAQVARVVSACKLARV